MSTHRSPFITSDHAYNDAALIASLTLVGRKNLEPVKRRRAKDVLEELDLLTVERDDADLAGG